MRGILCGLLSVFLYHFARFLVKLCYEISGISVWQLIAFRTSTVSLHFIVAILIKDKTLFVVPRPLRCLVLARCIAGAVTLALLFLSINYLTYSTGMVMYLLYPVITAIIAWVFLSERLSLIDVAGVFVSLLGVAFFAFPQLLGEPPLSAPSQGAEKNTPLGMVTGFL